MDGWINGWVSEWVNQWLDQGMNAWINEWINRWMDRRIEGWMNGWVEGWMGERATSHCEFPSTWSGVHCSSSVYCHWWSRCPPTARTCHERWDPKVGCWPLVQVSGWRLPSVALLGFPQLAELLAVAAHWIQLPNESPLLVDKYGINIIRCIQVIFISVWSRL